MSYDLLMQERMDRFRQLLNVLPFPEEIPGELLILSAGNVAGKWSYRHVFTTESTIYFIFKKAGYMDGRETVWECVDRELNEIMEFHVINNKSKGKHHLSLIG